MDLYIFIEKGAIEGTFNLGLLTPDKGVSEMKALKSLNAKGVKSVIEAGPPNPYFVGLNLRDTLREVQMSLIRERVSIPTQLTVHWVAPYKLPFDEIEWLYNYGRFSEVRPLPSSMLSELNLKDSGDSITNIANIYFALCGDYLKLS